ncbi:MAG: hypothetical protein ABIO40_05960 [Devosia sp.]
MAAWIFGVPAALAAVLYVVLLFHPIPLPFIASQVRNLVVAAMPPGSDIELGEMALAVEGYVWPVIQFSPVTYRDNVAGGKVEMDALEVGFSPIRALIGQPGASVTIVGPHIQVNQDLFGPRLSNFEIVADPGGGTSTVRILEGTSGFPQMGFGGDEGIQISGAPVTEGTRVRSDNDWLIFNLEAMQEGIAGIIEQARLGRFSRLVVKRGTLQMNDALYSTLRTFQNINFDITPSADGKVAEGLFSADYGGATMKGILERVIDDKGDARLRASITNFNMPAFLPTADTGPGGNVLDGTTSISIDVGFAAGTGKVEEGTFHVDLTGMDFVFGTDRFPIATSIIEIGWQPAEGLFTMKEASLTIGRTTGKMSGVFRLGIDELYGPIIGISMTGTDVMIRPNDLPEPEAGFDSISFRGWSAPLYGALGIDQSIMQKGNARLESRGRIDMLRKGIGFDMSIAGQAIEAADLKRIWPYFLAKEPRDWFVKNVTAGVVENVTMKYSFPVGSISQSADAPMPQNGVFIEMVGDGVKFKPFDDLPEIAVGGKIRLQMHDSEFSVAAENGTLDTGKGIISIPNAGMTMRPGDSGGIFELTGALNAPIPAIAEAVQKIAPGALKPEQLPFDLSLLGGTVSLGLTSTASLDANYAVQKVAYSVNGRVDDLGSTATIQGQTLANGDLAFLATQEGFRIGGTAELSGMKTALVVDGVLDGPKPDVTINATIDTAELGKLGFDAGGLASGPLTLSAKPRDDGAIDIALDLTKTSLNLKELGISKAAGTKGALKAQIKQTGDVSEVTGIDLGFGDVKVQGSLEFNAKKGLQSAQFSRFALSPGDAAQISLTPIKDGFQVRVRGKQFDLRPILGRTFNVSNAAGGTKAEPQGKAVADPPSALTQTLAIDAELDRAIGFYKTTAFNVDAELALKGTEMRKVSLQAQLGGGRSISVTTNPTDSGRVMSVVFNDMGSLLRLLGVYAQVEGGEGSLVLQTNTADKTDFGQFNIKNFAIVDEEKVAEVLGNHSESKKLIADKNKLAFKSAKIDFIRRADRVQITEGLLSGDTLGGTIKGFVYTDRQVLDLSGTYVPMFGVNNAFAKLFGPLGGSRNEGLFGISFAVTGPISNPDFKVNPLSALMPGAFRSLFEFRSREQK